MQDFKKFKKTIRDYHKKHGRHALPWRKTQDPYKILVSEYMLQQTQVGRVITKYELFMKIFPTFKKLARANNHDVLKAWQGLGYNRRALYLKQTAEIVDKKYNGVLPPSTHILEELPGIGPNTAAAICAYSFNIPVTFIETNIRRIFIHFFFAHTKRKITDEEILELVEKTLDRKNPRQWYSALMDYGTYLKSRVENPNRKSKTYAKQSKFKGSDREIRGKILRLLLNGKSVSQKKLISELQEKEDRVKKILETLVKDGFISIKKENVVLTK